MFPLTPISQEPPEQSAGSSSEHISIPPPLNPNPTRARRAFAARLAQRRKEAEAAAQAAQPGGHDDDDEDEEEEDDVIDLDDADPDVDDLDDDEEDEEDDIDDNAPDDIDDVERLVAGANEISDEVERNIEPEDFLGSDDSVEAEADDVGLVMKNSGRERGRSAASLQRIAPPRTGRES
jgi:hypothetical protein